MAINAFLASAITVPSAHMFKREEGLRCESLETCVTWYTTGSAQCSSGYEATPYTAPGDPMGTYCERECNDSEKQECAAQKCTFYTSECNTYPGSTICAKALDFCGTPIKTTKENCVRLRMGQAVTYDDDAGTCSVDDNPQADEHYLRFIIGKTSVDLNLFMSCAPVTSTGAQSVSNEVLQGINSCDFPDQSEYEIVWRCKEGKDKFNNLESIARRACASAAHPGDGEPVFQASRG